MPISERTETQLTGKAYWALLNKADQYGKYKIDLALSGDQLAKAQEMGLAIKQPKPDGAQSGPYVTFKVAATDEKRGPLESVPAFDAKGAPLTDLIGNGSDVTVNFAAGPYVFKGKFGIYAVLQSVTVHTLIPYNKKAA